MAKIRIPVGCGILLSVFNEMAQQYGWLLLPRTSYSNPTVQPCQLIKRPDYQEIDLCLFQDINFPAVVRKYIEHKA